MAGLVFAGWMSIDPSIIYGQAFSTLPDWSSNKTLASSSVVLGDVNRDGYLDAVFGNVGSGNTIYLNDVGTLRRVVAWSTDKDLQGDDTMDVALADLNADGYLDLVCANAGAPNKVYLNDRGHFPWDQEPTWQSLESDLSTGVGVADIDGDGDLDLYFSNNTQQDAAYANDGAGNFTLVPWAPSSSAATSRVAFGDLDDDGDLDLVCASAGSAPSPNAVFLNQGQSFVQSWVSSAPDVAWRVALGDLDGDGSLDLVFSTSEVYLNQASGFATAPDWSIQEPAFGVAVGDIDGNGDLEIAFGSFDGRNAIYDYPSNEPLWTSDLSRLTQDVALGDMDGDGDLDLVCANLRQANTLYLNTSIPFPGNADRPQTASATRAVALADFNSDGFPDMLLGNYDARDEIRLNTGGNFGSILYRSRDPETTWSVAVGDVNRDGHLDYVTGTDTVVVLYLHSGGTPPSFTALPLGKADVARTVVLGDITGDGLLDLVVGNQNNQVPNRLYAGNGLTLVQTEWAVGNSQSTLAAAIVDINADGDLDVVFANDGPNTCYLNRGGMLDTVPSWTGPEINSTSVDVGDVNGDGFADVVFGNWQATNEIYLNAGGSFPSEPTLFEPDRQTRGVGLTDLDLDGDLDVVTANFPPDMDIAYYNDGTGTFTEAWRAAENSDFSIGLAIGDTDVDGDPDLVFALPTPNTKVYHNRFNSASNRLVNGDPHMVSTHVTRSADDVLQLSFSIADNESDDVWVTAEYQYQGDVWQRIPMGVGSTLGPLATTPTGVEHSFSWNVSSLPFDRRDLSIRMRLFSWPSSAGLVQRVPALQQPIGPIWPRRPGVRLMAETIEFDQVSWGDTVQAVVGVRNIGGDTLTVYSVIPPSPELDVLATGPLRVSPGSVRNIPLRLAPETETDLSQPIEIHSDDPLAPIALQEILTDIRPLRVTTQLLNPDVLVPMGQQISVVVVPGPGVRLDGALLHYRPRHEPAAFESATLLAAGNLFFGLIPGEAVAETGVEYYVEMFNSPVVATDPIGAPTAGDSVYYKGVVVPDTLRFTPRVLTSAPRDSQDIDIAIGELATGLIPKSGTLHYRRGGDSSYKSVPLNIGETVAATIPAASVGSRGVEFWSELRTLTDTLRDPPTDWFSAPRSVRVSVTNLAETNSYPGRVYRMISIPLDFSENPVKPVTLEALVGGDAETGFGNYDPVKWRCFVYGADLDGYIELSNPKEQDRFELRPGRAFWIISASDGNRVTTSPITGLSTPTDAAYQVILPTSGWHQIGSPFDFAVRWKDVLVNNVPAGESDIVGAPLGWTGSGPTAVSILDPLTGYWVWSGSDEPVVLKVPPVAAAPQNRSQRTNHGIAGPPTLNEWTVSIAAVCDAAEDWTSHFGVSRDARVGFDRLDRPRPPAPPGRAMAVYFPHGDWEGHPPHYSIDIRGNYQPVDADVLKSTGGGSDVWGHVWAFDIVKNFSARRAGDVVDLTFSDIAAVPNDALVLLLDRKLGRVIDLRSNASYRLTLGERSDVTDEAGARFVVVVGSESFANNRRDELSNLPTKNALLQNHPNPFNPSTVIRYEVATAGRVRIEIYDAMGRLIKRFNEGWRRPGRYEVEWRGTNAHGESVATGMYFCRLEIGTFTEMGKMLLLK